MRFRLTRFVLCASAAVLLMSAVPATAQPLNPTNYSTIATSFAPTGAVTINTDTLQITGTGFTTVTGVTTAQQNGGPTLAVFDFGSINIPSSVTVSVTGSRPFALLSQGNATVAGTVNMSGGASTSPSGGAGVAGGGNGGNGWTTGSPRNGQIGNGAGAGGAGTDPSIGAFNGAGGGGFGGNGGGGGSQDGPSLSFGNGVGGSAYGNLLTTLQAGSGGGGGSGVSNDFGIGGGAGGGGIQLGALNAITITGSIIANGGASPGNQGPNVGGGGSGGGVLVTGSQIIVTSGIVNVQGGPGGFGGAGAGGGGGGGNIVLAPTVFTVGDVNNSQLLITGGSVGGSDGATAGQIGRTTLAPTQVVIPTAQSLTVTSGTIPGFTSFSTSSYAVAGSLTLTSSPQSITTLAGAGSVTLTGTTLTIGAGDSSGTFSGNITGNGGITKVGLGTLALTGTGNSFSGGLTVSAGTVQGSVASLPAAITDNGNVAFNETAGETFSGSITGTGAVTKLGSGTLTVSGTQGYSGGTTVNGGTMSVAADNSLGTAAATVAVNNGARLLYTASDSTSRTFNLVSGAVEAGSGVTLTYNGAAVTGGFLQGAGTHVLTGGASLSGTTTFAGATINQTGAATLTNFTNGGSLTNGAALTWAGGLNQSSGQVNVNNTINASNWSNNGIVTVATTGTLNYSGGNLYLGGGSQTYVGSIASPNTGGTISMPTGSTIELNGGLLQNNGTIGASGAGLVDINFGGLAKGSGNYAGGYSVNSGGKFQPGNSPGIVTTGTANWNAGGSFVFQINNAAGTAGANWSLNNINGTLAVNATPTSQFGISVQSLTAGNAPGPVVNFSATQSYQWTIAQTTGGIVGFNSAAFAIDSSGFSNPIGPSGTFSMGMQGNNLVLSFSPVPEPTLVLSVCAGGAVAFSWLRRRRR